jgi:hypothetical protein
LSTLQVNYSPGFWLNVWVAVSDALSVNAVPDMVPTRISCPLDGAAILMVFELKPTPSADRFSLGAKNR